MADNEPVTAPDQHKPGNRRAGRIGAVVSIIALVAMTQGNHQGRTEDIWLVSIAALLALALVGDVVLRRSGLRS